MISRKSFGMLVLSIISFGVATANAKISEGPNIGNFVLGSVEPEKLHYATKVRAFLILYDAVHRRGLSALLSEHDSAVIEGMVGAQNMFLAAEQEQYDNNFLGLCSRMETMDVESLASEYVQQAGAKKAIEAARYRAGFSRLSDTGQAIVEQYVADHVTPGIQVSVSNEVEDAKSDPEQYRFEMRIYCYVKEHGKLPPGSVGSSAVKEIITPKNETQSASGISATFEQ